MAHVDEESGRRIPYIMDGTNTKTAFNHLPKADVKIHMDVATSEKTTDIAHEVIFVPNQSDIIMMRVSDGLGLGKLTGHFKSVTSLTFSSANLELFSGSVDRAVLIWDCKGAAANAELEKQCDNVIQDTWSSSDED